MAEGTVTMMFSELGELERIARLATLNELRAEKEPCPTCKAPSREECKYRGEPVGCDHPGAVEEAKDVLAHEQPAVTVSDDLIRGACMASDVVDNPSCNWPGCNCQIVSAAVRYTATNLHSDLASENARLKEDLEKSKSIGKARGVQLVRAAEERDDLLAKLSKYEAPSDAKIERAINIYRNGMIQGDGRQASARAALKELGK